VSKTELVFNEYPKPIQMLIDSYVMVKRSSKHILRNTDQLFGTFFQPIMFLVLFTAVFGGAVAQALPQGVSYINFLMAGILIQTVAFGSSTTAVAITNDLKRGIVDRFKSLPMSNLAVLNGHVVSDLLRNLFSTAVLLTAGFVIGFRSSASALDWLTIIGLVLLFTFAISWLVSIVGVYAKSVESVNLLTFLIIFPLTFASSAFVPAESMTPILRGFAENQPITHIVEAIRSLMIGTPMDEHGYLAVIWCVGILLVAMPLAAYLFKNRSA